MNRQTLLAGLALAGVLAAPVAQAQSNGGKKDLVQKILQLQQPSIESMARQLVEMPAAQMLQQAGPALQQRVAADKREAVGREIQADARRYVEEAVPIVRDRAVKLASTTVGPILEEKLTEEELQQVLQVMQQTESPAYRKFNALGPELQRALGEKLVAETRGAVEPKMRAFQESVAKRLGISPTPAGAKPAASAASGARKN